MNPKNRTLMIVLGVIGLVIVAGAAAFLLSSGDDDSDSAVGSSTGGSVVGTDVASSPGAVAGETFPVEVVGESLPALEDPTADPAVGLAMPVISGKTFDGSAMTIGGAADGPTMYVYLAHWCPHCNDEIPELIALDERGDIPEGLDVVGISTAVAADRDNYPPSRWIADKGWPWPVMADDESATAFVASGGSGFPYTVLADADGSVIARSAGSRPADLIKLWLDANLAVVST